MLQYLPSIHRPWFESQALQGKIKSVWLLHTGQKTEIQRLLLNSVMVKSVGSGDQNSSASKGTLSPRLEPKSERREPIP